MPAVQINMKPSVSLTHSPQTKLSVLLLDLWSASQIPLANVIMVPQINTSSRADPENWESSTERQFD